MQWKAGVRSTSGSSDGGYETTIYFRGFSRLFLCIYTHMYTKEDVKIYNV